MARVVMRMRAMETAAVAMTMTGREVTLKLERNRASRVAFPPT
jgi:hypothetical protein